MLETTRSKLVPDRMRFYSIQALFISSNGQAVAAKKANSG